MSRFQAKQAARKGLKARIAIAAPAGAGKTTQALWLAEQLVEKDGALDGTEILVIDTEKGSAELYSKQPGADGDGTAFQHIDFIQPFSALELADEIDSRSGVHDVIIIDSLSHFWTGPGGILEVADSGGGNKLNGWRKATPMQDRMVASILNAKCHVICNMRAKTDRQIEQNRDGKLQMRTFGLKAVQRDDLIYEFTIVLNIDKDSHRTSVEKTRMRSIEGHTFQTPGDIKKLGRDIASWLDSDSLEAQQAAADLDALIDEQLDNATTALESLTEEDVAAANIDSDQLASIASVFAELPEGPIRNAAKDEFQNTMGDPRQLNSGRFDYAMDEAMSIVANSKAANA